MWDKPVDRSSHSADGDPSPKRSLRLEFDSVVRFVWKGGRVGGREQTLV
jgi:hypothetical protein